MSAATVGRPRVQPTLSHILPSTCRKKIFKLVFVDVYFVRVRGGGGRRGKMVMTMSVCR